MLFFKLITITLRAPFFHRLPSSGLKSCKEKVIFSESHFFLDPKNEILFVLSLPRCVRDNQPHYSYYYQPRLLLNPLHQE